MCEMFEKYNAGLIAVGEERGEKRGIEIGEKRGEKRGIEIGEKRGKFEGLRDVTTRIMTQFGKTLEDAMAYLQLTDEEKRQMRQAFQQ